MKKVIITLMTVFFVLSLTSCEKKEGISAKNTEVNDFMLLYGKTPKQVESALCNFVVSKEHYDADHNEYWVVTMKKNTEYMEIDGDDTRIAILFHDNICIMPSVTYINTVNNQESLRSLQDKYGRGEQLADNWYIWKLGDSTSNPSTMTYYGNAETNTLIIYRASRE